MASDDDAAAPQSLPFWVTQRHPNLTTDNHSVSSPRSGDYNCVAWALGDDDEWIEPGGRNGTSWPATIRDGDDLTPFIALFRSHGFDECDNPALDA